jgi:hypothetical protein
VSAWDKASIASCGRRTRRHLPRRLRRRPLRRIGPRRPTVPERVPAAAVVRRSFEVIELGSAWRRQPKRSWDS